MIEFCSDITVELVDSMASDRSVVQAAQVSLKGKNSPAENHPHLIKYLMSSRHGSPFEHNAFTFYSSAPIFVFREWHRHRHASINERSARYSELLPKFYIPGPERRMVNVGSSARPEMVMGSPKQYEKAIAGKKKIAEDAWAEYKRELQNGVSKEVARDVLPTSVYSEMYWTVNAHSLMNFLSLRIESDDSLVRSRPQWEIQMAATLVEVAFANKMPLTHEFFVAGGRVAP